MAKLQTALGNKETVMGKEFSVIDQTGVRINAITKRFMTTCYRYTLT